MSRKMVWEDCPNCDEVICNAHQMHAHDCDCEDVEWWIVEFGMLPYEIKMEDFECGTK